MPDELISAYLDTLDADDLVALVRRLAAADPAAARLLRTEAMAASQPDRLDPAAIARRAVQELPRSRFVDYRESSSVAYHAQQSLDELELLLDAGAADAVRPALEKLTTRLRGILEHADDSSGVIGDQGQRAVELYARSCREGSPKGPALARWLVTFRRTSPGWPNVDLAMFVDAFDERALQTYRRSVEEWDTATADAQRYERWDVRRALVELTDHDGDTDRAVRLLSSDAEHVEYGAIIKRLERAGRVAEAVDWLDRAVAEGRVSDRFGARTDYWVRPDDAVRLYLTADRPDDALAVLQRAFTQAVGPDTLSTLVTFADTLDRGAEMRSWALAAAEEQATQRHGNGARLITVYLAEDDLDAAWDAADRFGAGHAWRDLAEASASSRPARAAELYRPQIEQRLEHAKTKAYPEVATLLVEMGQLAMAGGDADGFAAYVADLRERFARRPSLIKALDRKGL